ncbi:AgmX/PglI C-terminal domain-containing protein [Myxococcaceae bacterium GXIMD 01537]
MAAGQNLAREAEGEVGGQWLMRQGELVLGPVSGELLVEKLYTGEVTGETPVARAGERGFQRLADTDAFRLHVVKAEARVRVEAQVQVERERARKLRFIWGGALAGVTLALAIGAWQVARYLAVHSGGGEAIDDITMDPPTITLAQARAEEEALLEYPTPGGAGSPGRKAGEGTGSKPVAVAARTERPAPGPGPTRRTGTLAEDPDGLATHAQFDQEAINRVVGTQQRTLHHCFKEEMERRPGFVAKVPIEFTIGNDGRVAQLWVDHPQLKKGPMYDCLLTELKKWPFKAFQGERPSVGLSFNLGPRG